ncbi:unnamed protein product [Amoebophrya sp. A25]|nr:unnamed protein product [Amoebophrya sp. A25]|eukprot:GSA25T00020572001.1
MRDKLDLYVNQREPQKFADMIENEARTELVTASFGKEMLQVLGELYINRAMLFLCDEVKSRFGAESLLASRAAFQRKWANRANIASTGYHALKQVRKAEKTMRKVEKAQADESKTEQERHEFAARATGDLEQQALPAFLRLAWAICVKDLEDTVKNVVRFLLKDASVPWILRIRRAQALLLLGEVFFEVGSKCGEKTSVGRELIETAMIGVLTKESAKQTEQDQGGPTYHGD